MGVQVFNGKTIVFGVCGGIAAYKAVDVASKLTQLGATVKTVMTKNATQFVGPITFQSVTGQPAVIDLFAAETQTQIEHISLAQSADLMLVAPATANMLAKVACGLADDALSTTLLAARSPIILAPAMNNFMWLNPATQENLKTVKGRGILVIEPEVGRLACGEGEAVGRFPETGTIISYIERLLLRSYDLAGRTVLVTAGGTHEPIDPVRFIGNRSSGKMGYAVARAAKEHGAKVILISGPTALKTPAGVARIDVETAREMHQAVMEHLKQVDAVVMTAAVADFRPARESAEKIKKERMARAIELELNPDILKALAEQKNGKLVVGFAAESENIIENASGKLKRKNLDLIVANDIAKPGVGFGSDYNLAVFVDENGPLGELATYSKDDLAEKIVDWLAAKLKTQPGG